MKILIIEDETLAAEQLGHFIKQHDNQSQIVGHLRSIEEGKKWFDTNPMPDLIFSDIELLDGNVFNLYERTNITCPIIFTTAYDQFLLQAFRGNGIAYLLKPFDYEQFTEAILKFKQLKSSFNNPTQTLPNDILSQLKNALQPARSFKQRFTVKMRNGIYILSIEDIAYIQAEDGVVFAFDKNQQKYPLIGSLNDIEESLDPIHFFRINRSDLIHIRYIEKLETYFNDRLLVKIRGFAQPLIASAARTPDLRKWLEG